MIYELIGEKPEGTRTVRTYRNSNTGTETKLSLLYTDKEGGKWWAFLDLFKIPIMRMSMARNITDLYTIGLTLKDIVTWCNEEKKILKSEDPEKYEKLYSLILEKERLATFTADPLKQQLALCTVYILADDERVDYFDESLCEQKLKVWKGLPEMVAFFLTWHTGHIQNSLRRLDRISTTVLKLQDQQTAIQKVQLKALKGLEPGTESNNFSSGQSPTV